MRKYPLLCLLASALAWGQAGTAKPAAPKSPAAQSTRPTSPSSSGSQDVGPESAVITIPGVCDKKPAAAGAACKTVVTRAQFDDLVQTMAPNIQPAQKKQLATQYAMALVMAHKAHEMHLDQGPKYEERLRLAKLGVLNKALAESLQEQAANISEKELQDYYKANSVAYEEIDLQRIFVPKVKPQENKDADQPKTPAPSEEEAKKKEQESEEATKKLADALRARAAAGEDFDKLQDEAYTGTGMKNKPPTKLGKVRRNGLPPDQLSVLDGKSGEVSQPISNPSGYFIYKVGEKDTLPFDQVKQEISSTLSQQKLRDEMQAIQQSATPELNEKYFAEGTPGAAAKPEAQAKPPAATKGADPK